MAKHLLIVVTNPVPGREEEFNHWYSGRHLDDVLRIPGFVAAQRFKLTMDGAQSLPGPYLAIYEMETNDPEATFAELAKAAESGQMLLSPALDTTNIVSSIFTPITERKAHASASA